MAERELGLSSVCMAQEALLLLLLLHHVEEDTHTDANRQPTGGQRGHSRGKNKRDVYIIRVDAAQSSVVVNIPRLSRG